MIRIMAIALLINLVSLTMSAQIIQQPGYDSKERTSDAGVVVQGEDKEEEDLECEDMVVLTNEFENGSYFDSTHEQRLAVNIPVNEGFTAYGIKSNILVYVDYTISSFSFIFYDDNAGLPGNEIDTREGIIMEEEWVEFNHGADFVEYTIAFDTPIDFDSNTTYWIEIQTDGFAWDQTSDLSNLLGGLDAFQNDETDGNWVYMEEDQFVFNLICDEFLSVSRTILEGLTYYPNPTTGILNLNSDKNIQDISVFNMLGQVVLSLNVESTTTTIDLSALLTGTYFMTVTMDGQIGTYKVMKN